MIVSDSRCGCIYDDAIMDTTHTPEGHYPIGTGPKTFCKRCDLYRPCVCQEDAERFQRTLDNERRARGGNGA